MKKLLFAIFLFVYLIGYSQTADQIIANHLEVTGGVQNWKKLNSIIIKGEIILDLYESYPIEIYQQRPDLNKTVLQIQGKKNILNGYNGKNAVRYNFQTNQVEENDNYITEAFESDLVDYSVKGFHAILLGTENIENKNCYKIKLIKNSEYDIYYFDKSTFQLIREDNKLESKSYSDFNLFSGLTLPCHIEVKNKVENEYFVLIFTSIDINKVIPEKEFKF